MADRLAVGDVVSFPWSSIHEAQGVVASLYENPPPGQVLIQLTPEITGWVVDEPTTVVVPRDQVRVVKSAAA